MGLAELIGGWLAALKLQGRVFLGLFLFCALLLVLDYAGVVLLGAVHQLAWLLAFLGLLLFGCLLLGVGLGEGYDAAKRIGAERRVRRRQQTRCQEDEAARVQFKALVLRRLDFLGPGEHRILADCLRGNQQSFKGSLDDAEITSLRGARLISRPDGVGNLLADYPHYVTDFVWEELLQRRDEFLAKDDENIRRETEELAEQRRQRRD